MRPRLVVAFVVAAAGLVTAVWLPTRNDAADAAERNRSMDGRLSWSLPAFADDFGGPRGSTVDPAKWVMRTDRIGGGLQFSQSVRNARLDGEGNLVIVLRGEENNTFSTARLYSRATLRGTAGHVEARIKAPAGEGLQPAFELVSADRPDARLNVLAEPITDDDFHTYAVDWKPGELTFSVDGNEVRRQTLGRLDTGRPFRLALALTVDDRERADLPARLTVDSISFSSAGASAKPEPSAPKPPTTAPTTTPPTSDPSTEPTTEPPASAPTSAPAETPTTTPPTSAPAAPQWAPFTDYVAGQLVTFKKVRYQVLETHTSLPGWEPTAVPALFKKI
jgi:hypothetical protein